MNNHKKLQVRIDEYAFGVWFDTVDIDPYSQTVRIYDHLFDKEQTFSDSDNKMVYREVETPLPDGLTSSGHIKYLTYDPKAKLYCDANSFSGYINYRECNTMNLKIKRLTQTAKLPERAFPTEAGFDLFTDEAIMIESNQTVAISTGIALEIPDGYYGRLKGRSGLTLKSPLRVLEGTVDSSYRGEVKVMADVKKGCTYHVPKGAKIAQLIIQPLPYFEVVEVDELSQSDRGENGFGSTGV